MGHDLKPNLSKIIFIISFIFKQLNILLVFSLFTDDRINVYEVVLLNVSEL